MINLRYHIVSITAVFLALGIGVMLGSTFLDRYTVDQLDKNISSVESRISEVRSENERLSAAAEAAARRDQVLQEAATTQVFSGLAVDVPIVIVSIDGIDEASTQNTIRALMTSGADYRGSLTVTSNFNLDDARALAVAESLGLDSVNPASVRRDAVRLLAEALTAGGQIGDLGGDDPDLPDEQSDTTVGTDTTIPTVPTTPGDPGSTGPGTPSSPGGGEGEGSEAVFEPVTPDVVMALMAHGLLSFRGPEGAPEDPLLSGQGYRYVFLSGPSPVIPDEQVLLPLLRAMASEAPIPGVVASAAEPARADSTRDAVVGAIREDEVLVRSVSTVDNLESFNGLVSVMLAVDQVSDGVFGHYGEGDGVTAPLPVGP